MKRGFGFVASLCGLALVLAPAAVLASGGSGGGGGGGVPSTRGSVEMKGASVHGGSPQGVGQVTPNGGYYTAPTLSCSATISNVNLIHIPDGTPVVVTLEYLDPGMAPVVVGTITLSGGGGSFSTGNNPISVSTASKVNTMSVRTMDGTVIMTGSIRGL